MPPKVFVSHASEDKDRFVLDFAERLRSKGVDAWVDAWEILPGDSLVDKIFEEGLKEADAVVIVLSQNSVGKPWVREELNASVVKRVEDRTKIIPVVIDECRVPEPLRSTVWKRIEDLTSYKEEFSEILDAIFERRSKPPIGGSPRYTNVSVNSVSGLTHSEEFILAQTAQKSVEAFPLPPAEEELREELQDHGLSKARIHEGFTVLKNRGYIDAKQMADGSLGAIKLIQHGWRTYAKQAVDKHDARIRRVASEIVNQDDLRTSGDISDELGLPAWFTAYAFRELSRKGLVETSRLGSGGEMVTRKSSELERWLRLNG
jgi:hypothetical protein